MPSFVKVTKVESSTGTSASGNVTVTTAGDAFVVCALNYNNLNTTATPTVQDDNGDTFTVDTSGNFSGGFGDWNGASISSAPNINAGTALVTIQTNSSANTGATAAIYEISGTPTSSIRDATSPAINTGAAGTTASTNSLTNVTASAIFFAVTGTNDPGNPTTLTGTSSGWSYPAGGTELNGATFSNMGSGYKPVSSTGAETSSWTIVNNANWGALIAVYKGTGGGGVNYPTTIPLTQYDNKPYSVAGNIVGIRNSLNEEAQAA